LKLSKTEKLSLLIISFDVLLALSLIFTFNIDVLKVLSYLFVFPKIKSMLDVFFLAFGVLMCACMYFVFVDAEKHAKSEK